MKIQAFVTVKPTESCPGEPDYQMEWLASGESNDTNAFQCSIIGDSLSGESGMRKLLTNLSADLINGKSSHEAFTKDGIEFIPSYVNRKWDNREDFTPADLSVWNVKIVRAWVAEA